MTSPIIIRQHLVTPWSEFLREWTSCKRCHYAANRSHTVQVRGRLPCDILFIGEAPGDPEDQLGFPFVGEVGAVLNAWIKEAGLADVRYALVNTVACKPFKSPPIKPPDAKALKACRPRFDQLLAMAKPKRIICVGNIATSYRTTLPKEIPVDSIPHPVSYLKAERVRAAQFEKQASLCLRRVADELIARTV